MNNSQTSQIVRGILFAVGFGITLLAIILLAPLSPSSSAGTFTAVNLLLLYVLIFMPLLMEEPLAKLTGGRIVALGIYWYAVAAYAALTLFLIRMANTGSDVSIRLLFVVQLAALFALMLTAYMSSVTHEHVDAVERAGKNQRVSIEWLRSLADQLKLEASQLAGAGMPRGDELAALAESLADDLRYLSPISNATASSLENSIAADLDSMLRLIDTTDVGYQAIAQACDIGFQTKKLVAQRKAMLN